MLTGTDTVASAFAATAHRYGDRPALVGAGRSTSWAELATSVRLLTLGLDAGGVEPGSRVGVAVGDEADRRALELALAGLGAVRVVAAGDGTGAGTVVEDRDLGSLREAGARVDDGDPDRFERRSRRVEADEPAVEDATATWSQSRLLWAAHSLATSTAVTVDDRVLSTWPPAEVTGWVCGALLPVVSGAAASIHPGTGRAALEAVRPTVLVCGEPEAAAFVDDGTPAAGPRRRRRARLLGRGYGPPPGLDQCRVAVVVGGGPGAARLTAAGVPARVAVTWPAHAGLVTGAAGPPGGLGHPLPGVTIGIADDGEVLVRSQSVAEGWCDDGWLHTGWRGEIDGAGRLWAGADSAMAP